MRSRHSLLSSLLGAAGLLAAVSASAQSQAPSATPPAAAPEATSQGVVVAQPYYVEERGRFLFGFEVGLGVTAGFRGPATGAGFGLGAATRIGWQFNNLVSLYYQPAITVGFVGGDLSGLFVAESNTLGLGFTLGNFFHFGIGPALDVVISSAMLRGGPNSALGFAPGGDARIAFSLGGRSFSGRRTGFTLSLHTHDVYDLTNQTFYLTALVGVGMDWY